MDSLRKIGNKVFSKANMETFSSSGKKKPRDRTLRHSRSVPLLDTEVTPPPNVRRGPIYKGSKPLKTRDVRIVKDAHVVPHPRGLVDDAEKYVPDGASRAAPAPKVIVREPQATMELKSKSQPKPSPSPKVARSTPEQSNMDIIRQFPMPDKDLPPLPLRIPLKKPFSSDPGRNDHLPPNPAFDKSEYSRLKSGSKYMPVHQRSASANVLGRPAGETSRRYYGATDDLDEDERIRKPSPSLYKQNNLSTKSLGANMLFGASARLKQGPVAHPVVVHNHKSSVSSISPPTPSQPRGRMQSNASVTSFDVKPDNGAIPRPIRHIRPKRPSSPTQLFSEPGPDLLYDFNGPPPSYQARRQQLLAAQRAKESAR